MHTALSRSSALASLFGLLALSCTAAVPPSAAPAAGALAPVEAPPAVSVPGRDLPLRSSGAAEAESWVLRQSGFVGVFLRVAADGRVAVRVNASGPPDPTEEPKLRLAIADQSRVEVVRDQPRAFEWAGELRAGTYLLRVDFVNGAPGTKRYLRVHGVSVQGASVLPDASDHNALDTANTFIRNYRKGTARFRVTGVKPGEPLHFKLERHAFHFGLNIPGANNRMLPDSPAPGSEAARFQQMLLENFNTVVLSNGGKWVYHEEERDQLKLDYVDKFLFFARDHALRARMHTLLWDTQQQPPWVVSEDAKQPGLLTRAARGDAQAKEELEKQIAERIYYLVRQRAAAYDELDVLNESLHRKRYWQTFGAEGMAEIFNQVAKAVAEAGAHTQLFLNEYNLLQWSTDPETQAPDPYANWYRWHAEELERAGGTLHGLGVQYYTDGRGESEIGENAHSPARIFGVLQNLSGTGLALTLSEFTVNGGKGVSPERGADIVEETLRLVFGTPAAQSALIWSVWAGASQDPTPPSVLFDQNFALTPAGERYRKLMREEWNTDVTLPVPAEGGTLELEGFLGDYSVESGGKRGCLRLYHGTHDTLSVRLEEAPPPAPGAPVCAPPRLQTY